ncbi:MAG: hypothetical protein AAFY26_12000 [Cyanobacteria bacterium J06638_22]
MVDKNPVSGKKRPSRPRSMSNGASRRMAVPEPATAGNFSNRIESPWTVPVHEPGRLIPGDMYDPSTSSAPRIDRETAEQRINDYDEMKAAQEVASAGYNFVSGVFKTHTSYQKALGEGFNALRETLATRRREVAAATAFVDAHTEEMKFARSVQLNQQAEIGLRGEESKTQLMQERTDTEIVQLQANIQALKAQAQAALDKAQTMNSPA